MWFNTWFDPLYFSLSTLAPADGGVIQYTHASLNNYSWYYCVQLHDYTCSVSLIQPWTGHCRFQRLLFMYVSEIKNMSDNSGGGEGVGGTGMLSLQENKHAS